MPSLKNTQQGALEGLTVPCVKNDLTPSFRVLSFSPHGNASSLLPSDPLPVVPLFQVSGTQPRTWTFRNVQGHSLEQTLSHIVKERCTRHPNVQLRIHFYLTHCYVWVLSAWSRHRLTKPLLKASAQLWHKNEKKPSFLRIYLSKMFSVRKFTGLFWLLKVDKFHIT